MNQARRINLKQWILLGLGIALLLLIFFPRSSAIPDLEISEVLQLAENGQVAKIQISGDDLRVDTIDGKTFNSRRPREKDQQQQSYP